MDYKWLKGERRRLGLTQKQMAKLLGIGISLYQKMEHGGAVDTIRETVMYKIAEGLDKPVEWVEEKCAGKSFYQEDCVHNKYGRTCKALKDIYCKFEDKPCKFYEKGDGLG